jgi:diamine N-acetyltransferase
MIKLSGTTVKLRALEPEDLDFLYDAENNTEVWEVSGTQAPYSRFLLQQYLENAHQDLYQAKQLRLVIGLAESDRALGLIDIYDFDPVHKRAGVGILISSAQDRGRGFASEALELLINYCFEVVSLHQLYANIGAGNLASERLFTNFGFEQIGVKKDWNYLGGQFCDEHMFQLINTRKF